MVKIEVGMVKRKQIASVIGSVGLFCSLVFWLLLCMGNATGHFDRERLMKGLDALFLVWVWIWPVSLLLALVAAGMGSRRWYFATLLPVFSFLISVSILSSVPF